MPLKPNGNFAKMPNRRFTPTLVFWLERHFHGELDKIARSRSAEEFLEVEMVVAGPDELKVAVPNTIVELRLRRRGDVYEGILGSRVFAFLCADVTSAKAN